MRAWSAREARYWRAAWSLLAAIYLSAWPMQFALDYLRAHNLLRISMAALFAVAGVAAIVWLARRRAGPREGAALLAVAAVYGVLALRLRIVQERLHLIEYGLLGLLFAAALASRAAAAPAAARHVRWRVAAGAFLLTAAGGLVDELIQGALPNRQYDLRDVVTNAAAGALALAAAALLAAARARDGRAGAPR